MLPVMSISFVLPTITQSLDHAQRTAGGRTTPDNVAYRSTDFEFSTQELAEMRAARVEPRVNTIEQSAFIGNQISRSAACAEALMILQRDGHDAFIRMLETEVMVGDSIIGAIKEGTIEKPDGFKDHTDFVSFSKRFNLK